MAKPIVLYGPTGRAIAQGQGANLLFEGAQKQRGTAARPRTDRDFNQNLSSLGFRELLSAGRFIYANCPPLRFAINKLADLAVGNAFTSEYYGNNRAWGDNAEEMLLQWHKIFDVRGGVFDWATDLRVWDKHIIRDGDVAIVLVETPSGFPMVQTIPAHRVGGPLWQRGIIPDGPYAGRAIVNGVIFDDFQRAIAIRVVDALGYNPVDVSLVTVIDADSGEILQTRDAILTYDPDWADQGRGISWLASGLNDATDIKTAKDFVKMALQKEASFAVVEYNESGNADAATEFTRTGPGTDTPAAALYTEKVEGGLTQIYKANSGSKVEFPESNRPSAEFRAFWEDVKRDAFAAIGWPMEFYDSKGVGGAALRLVMEIAQPTIERLQAIDQKVAAAIDGWKVAKSIKAGELPFDPDWWKWAHLPPEEMTADKGWSAQIDREDYKLGFTSLNRVARRRGIGRGRDLIAERRDEAAEFLAAAAKAAKDHNAANPEMPITIDAALALLRQASANPPTNNAQPAQTEAQPSNDNADSNQQ